MHFRRMFPALAVLVFSSTAWAGLIGTSVTGSLFLGPALADYYVSASGATVSYLGIFAPTATQPVTISDPGLEFRMTHVAGLVSSADFTDSGLSVTWVPRGFADIVTQIFTSNAFEGLTVSEVSDNFPHGVTASITGSTLTVLWGAGAYPDTGETFTAVYGFSSATPEASTFTLLTSAIAGLGFLGIRCRRREK